MATIVVERLAKGDYLPGCAALPREYGSASWEGLPEVAAIRAAVFATLDRLDAEENTTERTIDYHVHCLRAKLRDCGLNEGVISSVRGIGYVFTPPNVRHGSEEG